jgi:hypothetical protein
MGVLDDAIKEHLELKRRHGVPEEELQRQEEEALGPARREVAQQPEEAEPDLAQTPVADDGEPPEAAAEDESALAAEDETALFDMEADAAPDALVGTEAPEHVDEVEPSPSRPIEVVEPGEAAVGEPGHDPDPHRALGDTEPHGFEAIEDEEELEGEVGDEELDEPDDDELLSAEEEAGAEEGDQDVLEDTPDFLQETPEHDRLWFEQKPPRDFDFD